MSEGGLECPGLSQIPRARASIWALCRGCLRNSRSAPVLLGPSGDHGWDMESSGESVRPGVRQRGRSPPAPPRSRAKQTGPAQHQGQTHDPLTPRSAGGQVEAFNPFLACGKHRLGTGPPKSHMSRSVSAPSWSHVGGTANTSHSGRGRRRAAHQGDFAGRGSNGTGGQGRCQQTNNRDDVRTHATRGGVDLPSIVNHQSGAS